MFWKSYSDEGNRRYMLRSGIWEGSKNSKSCLMAKRRAGQLAFAQTIPEHRLTTPLRLLRSSDRFLQRRMSLLPLPQKVYFNQLLRFLACTNGKCYGPNRLKTWQMARLGGYRLRKSFRRARCLGSYIFTDVRLENPENSPISTKILRGWRMAGAPSEGD